MAYYLMSPDSKPTQLAPSVVSNSKTNNDEASQDVKESSPDDSNNPTVLPLETLKKFHFAFLIRHPRRGIPSFYRCCVPPLGEITGFTHFMNNEAGYSELRRMFDYLREQRLVGPSVAGQTPTTEGEVTITVIDADDLLDNPQAVIETFCRETGIPYTPDMLKWEDEENQKYVSDAFAKWIGFHNDAIHSTELTARTHHVSTLPIYSASLLLREGNL